MTDALATPFDIVTDGAAAAVVFTALFDTGATVTGALATPFDIVTDGAAAAVVFTALFDTVGDAFTFGTATAGEVELTEGFGIAGLGLWAFVPVGIACLTPC